MTDDRDILDRARYIADNLPIGGGVWVSSARFALRECADEIARLRSYKSLPQGMVWQDYYSPDDVIAIREPLDAEIEELRDLTQAQNGYNAQMTDERDEARADNKRLRTALEAAHDSASHWEGLWRQDLETAATALRERDEALAEVERLRGNQRVEVVEGWHGIAKGSD